MSRKMRSVYIPWLSFFSKVEEHAEADGGSLSRRLVLCFQHSEFQSCSFRMVPHSE